MNIIAYAKSQVENPTAIHQDKNAAITMIDNNSVKFWRNKHRIVRRNYISEKVENKECKFVHTPSEEMITDVGTKPLNAKVLKTFMNALGMRIEIHSQRN